MLKKVLMGAFTTLSIGIMLSLNTVSAKALSNIKIDESNNVQLIANYEDISEVTAVQLSLKVDSDVDADISFEFNSENSIKISEYRYNAKTNCLNIYMSDSKSLFKGDESLDIGTVSAIDAKGNAVDVKIDVVKDSLKYVYQNVLENDEFEVDIATKPATTTTQTTTSTTKPTTTTTKATTTTTKATTTTTKATTSTTKPTTTTTKATTTTTKPTTTMTTTTTTNPTTTATTSTTTATTESTTTTTVTTTEKPVTTVATTTAANNGHVASDDEFCQWAINDYKNTTEITAANAELVENVDGMYEITLSDEEGKVLDTYTINPDTGVGTNSANEEVNLPQTGNNSMKNILIAVLALILTGFGLCVVKISGVIRREEYEK
ncbi:MAG: LPXTG cell wall anchor domain-containing protein [Ruminococcus sp.]|nr:LPXTG cell wall anchor domain-containing protein [Ruminococcus sp.]